MKSIFLAVLIVAGSGWAYGPQDFPVWTRVFRGDTLLPGATHISGAIATDIYQGGPQYFTLYLDVDSLNATMGAGKISGYVLTGKDSSQCNYVEWSAGDTAQFITAANAYQGLGKIAVQLAVPGGNWFKVAITNEASGDTCALDADSCWVWMKH